MGRDPAPLPGARAATPSTPGVGVRDARCKASRRSSRAVPCMLALTKTHNPNDIQRMFTEVYLITRQAGLGAPT